MKTRVLIHFIITVSIIISGCRVYDVAPVQFEEHTPRPLPQDGTFKFSVFEPVSLSVTLLLNDTTPYPNARVSVVNSKNELLLQSVSNQQGVVYIDRTLHTTDTIIGIAVSAVGFPADTLWISPWDSPSIVLSLQSYQQPEQSNITLKVSNGLGIPDNLVDDIYIPAELLSDINNAFPERSPVPTFHPEYIHNGTESELLITEDSSEVWVTFIHEGAGHRNSFGYFTYTDGIPPASASALDLIPIFSNASYKNSGGGLYTGNTVSIGTFSKNTRIGFWVVANGWSGNSIDWNKPTYYSTPDFNPESTDSERRHLASLYHPDYDIVVLAFEDLNRSSPSCDNDFNDIIFTVSWNPVTAVDINALHNVPGEVDTDSDGISDNNDDYPTDPDKAFNIYTPSQGHFGLLAYEDLFPRMGDYDFNDVVLHYSMHEVTNAALNVSSITGTLIFEASGAHLKNGFAISFGMTPQPLSWTVSASFSTLNSSFTTLDNGELLFVIAEDVKTLFRNSPTGFVNTITEQPHIDGDTIVFELQFAEPVTLAVPPYNPFIFRTNGEELEIHLPFQEPTYRFKTSLFGREDDASTPADGRYFMNSYNMPWAIHTGPNWKHPTETRNIGTAYGSFDNWVTSGGNGYRDWESTNLNSTELYRKKK